MLADASSLRLFVLAGCVLLAAGCGEPEIQSYTVPRIQKASVPAATGNAQQMLGGILLAGKTAWFFKVMDDPAIVGPQTAAFKSWLETVRVNEGSDPTWELPGGWRAEPGSQFRFATLVMGKEEDALKLAVSKLDFPGGDPNPYLLANLNRWRGQVQLPEWNEKEMLAGIERIKAGEGEVIYVDLKGTGSGGGMTPGMTPPFANRPPPPKVDVPMTAAEVSNAGLAFDMPEGWKQVQPKSPIVKLAFVAKDDEAILEITVTPLSGPAGGPLENVIRWRDQLKLPRIEEAEITAAFKEIPSGLGEAKWIEIADNSDPKRAIDAAIISTPETTWFVKAMGSAAVAEKEREHVLAFIKSLKTEN